MLLVCLSFPFIVSGVAHALTSNVIIEVPSIRAKVPRFISGSFVGSSFAKYPLDAQQARLKALQAKKLAEQRRLQLQAQTAVKPAYIAPQGVTNCGSDPYMAFIYQHESGCRTNAINSIGCAGLGQACPGSKLPCSLSDWSCQNAYFTNYAVSRYGSTYNAYQFWIARHWW